MNSIKSKILLEENGLNTSLKRPKYICCLSSLLTVFFLLISFQVMSVTSVQNDLLVRPESDGSLRLSAEKGKAIGPDIKYMPEWKAFGWFGAKDRVEWNVLIKKSGEYDVFLEWSVSDEEAGKPFVLVTRDNQLKNKVGKTGSWETFKSMKIGSIRLSKGKQVMTFKSDAAFSEGALLDLREVKLVPVATKASPMKSSTDSQYLLGYEKRKPKGFYGRIFHQIVTLDDSAKLLAVIPRGISLFALWKDDKVTYIPRKRCRLGEFNIYGRTDVT